tara:strand:+ start:240 stop:431 length:192 start_codon:yes stop_codon:yes gene_type:complete
MKGKTEKLKNFTFDKIRLFLLGVVALAVNFQLKQMMIRVLSSKYAKILTSFSVRWVRSYIDTH